MTSGKVTRGSIGISFSEENSSNPVLLRELGAAYGIVVQGVETGSPAEKAGLKPGDLITDVNGHPVRTGSDFVDPIADTPVGQNVQLRYMRNKEAHEVSVVVADRSKLFPNTSEELETSPEGIEPAEFGLHVEDLTPELARKLGITKQAGVIVSEVEPASFAEDIEFVRGDIIVEVNHVPVANLNEYRREVARLKPGQDVLFKVIRHDANDRELTVFLAGAVPTE